MGEGRVQPDRGGQPPRREVEQPDYDWEEIDWLEETPPEDDVPAQPTPRRTIRQQPAAQPQQRQAPAQQRPRQQTYDQRPPQRPAPRQQQTYQAPPPRRQPQAEPRRNDRRAVAVEPDDYRRRRKRKTSVPLIILVVILMGGVLFAGGKLGSILLNYHRDRSAYNDLADAALAGLAEPNATTEPGATPEPEEEQVRSEVPISVDWDYLHSVNTDIVGWLYCPNTMINYPLMQTSDNDYYLHRSYDRQPNVAGALFADYNAAMGIVSSNFIVYGHNMKDGSMFATIYDYVNQEFYNQHPVMYLLTPTQNYRVDLISAHIVESTLDNYPGYFQTGEYQDYLNLITSSSFFRTNATVSTDYQLITMSTCDYSQNYRDPRFLLHGLMVPVV